MTVFISLVHFIFVYFQLNLMEMTLNQSNKENFLCYVFVYNQFQIRLYKQIVVFACLLVRMYVFMRAVHSYTCVYTIHIVLCCAWLHACLLHFLK